MAKNAEEVLLELIGLEPAKVREAIEGKPVQRALQSIGVVLDPMTTFRVVHTAGDNARKDTGKGDTACGRKGYRHPTFVTCKGCLKELARRS